MLVIGARLLVGVRRWKHDVGEHGSFGEEHVLNDHETFVQRKRIESSDRQDSSRQRKALSACRLWRRRTSPGIEAGLSGTPPCHSPGTGLLRNGAIAGKQVGVEAHVGCTARVSVVAKTNELRAWERVYQCSDESARSSEPKATTSFSSASSLSRRSVKDCAVVPLTPRFCATEALPPRKETKAASPLSVLTCAKAVA